MKGKNTDAYSGIGETEQVEETPGLGLFPVQAGQTNHGLRKFLVFYFDNDEDYEIVLQAFKKKVTITRSHPDLNSKGLVDAAKKIIESDE